jgi:regulator of sigma D
MTYIVTPIFSSNPPTGGERRARTRAFIQKLLAERAQMLVLYFRVAGLAPYQSPEPVQELLDQFCQLLVDYVAAGHFGLYYRITNGTERRREVAELADKIYPRIAQTTERAVEFNDRHDAKRVEDPQSLSRDLSSLGEEIAQRIDLEDQIIAAMLR